MQIHYLEIVTKDVNATCTTYAELHGVTFKAGDASLGNARTAALSNGGMIGVRAPMHESEVPVVRPYLLVEDVTAAMALAVETGAEIALPPMEIEGYGKFAIYNQGGIQHGLWQL
jgi:predicted enzyme related to lactoylglutathione lyase